MFAVAQKEYVYLYDNTGTELHRLSRHHRASRLDFLPFHFLLVSVVSLLVERLRARPHPFTARGLRSGSHPFTARGLRSGSHPFTARGLRSGSHPFTARGPRSGSHPSLPCLQGERGLLRYHDVSTGQFLIEHRTKAGSCDCLSHNPHNAVVHCGHNNGGCVCDCVHVTVCSVWVCAVCDCV